MSKLQKLSTSDSFNLSSKEPSNPNKINWVVVSVGLGTFAFGLFLLGRYLKGSFNKGLGKIEAKIDGHIDVPLKTSLITPISTPKAKEDNKPLDLPNQPVIPEKEPESPESEKV